MSEDHKFNKLQNDAFAGIFDALGKKGATFEVQAHTIVEMDDANFIKLWKDPNCTIIGTDEEIAKSDQRARDLRLIDYI